MKKIIMLLSLITVVFFANAQDKMFKTVNNAFILGQFENAKIEIDKVMADPKAQAKAEGWLWKSKINAEIYNNDQLFAKYPNAGKDAFEAFKKYESMEADYKTLSNADNNWRAADLIYVASFNGGRKLFTEKKWNEAYETFVMAEYIGDIFIKKDLRKTGAKIDTFVVIYTAYAAQNAKRTDDAAFYYEKLANQKIGGDDYKDIYSFLLIHFADKKEKDKFFKYLSVAKEVYPNADWDDYEFDYFTKNYTLQEKNESYNKADAAGTLTAKQYMLYGQMFSELAREDKSLDSASQSSYVKKSTEAYIKAYNKDNNLGLAAFNAGVNYYNEFNGYDDKIANNRKAMQDLNSQKIIEKDPKKKAAAEAALKAKLDAIKKLNADIDVPLMQSLDNAINWLEKSFVVLKTKEHRDKVTKSCLNSAVKWLANCYQYKKDKVKGKDPKAYDALEAKYKEYDALYEKF